MKRLPFAPMQAAVERSGLVHALLFPRNTKDARTWYEARARGYFTWKQADHIAVKLLGRHPAEIYGDTWWD